MERKIGEVFEYQGRKLKVVEAVDTCKGCVFIDEDCNCEDLYSAVGACSAISRTDKKPVIIVESEQPAPQEEQKLNLCEILKDCPKGTKFYSPVFGEVTFKRIIHNTKWSFPIEVLDEGKTCKTFMSDGRYDHFNKECLLFPSKDQRDWSKWQCPKPKKPKFDPKTLKAFDRVLISDAYDVWQVEYFSHIKTHEPGGWCQCLGDSYYICIPYNDETKHLVGTTDEAPEYYRYWED